MATHAVRKVMFLRVPEALHARVLARQAPRESLNALACRLLAAGCDFESSELKRDEARGAGR